MRRLGLTGGIATGKSTVSRMLADCGAAIIDADLLAREVVEPGQPALVELGTRFPGVVKNGALDRAELGKRIFGNDAERAALNAIIHPRIGALMLERTLALEAAGTRVSIYDAALLIENKLHLAVEGVILVVAPLEVQRARLMARNQLTRAEADARIASQMPLEEKRAFATWIIDNGGSLEDTQRQVELLWKKL